MEEIIKASKAEASLANFLRLLTERGRIQYLGVIAEAFQELMDEELGVVRAKVKTAVPLSDSMKEKMKEILSEVTGKQVALVTEEDPDIIGGVVAYVGDMVWDGSIRSQLDGFKESIGGAK
jgi:F-type H+-transporting ATPase subunit delta